jgi:SH3-like domain-containing protein
VALFASLSAALAQTGAPANPPAAQVQTGPSGLALPRFVSIRSVPVNIRRGPTREHEILWTYQKAGVPVEVIQEFENWRRIRDADGQEGWVLQTLLSGRRTALVAPWDAAKKTLTPLRGAANPQALVVALIEPNVLANVLSCSAGWCRVSGEGFNGFIEANRLWGVKPDEEID